MISKRLSILTALALTAAAPAPYHGHGTEPFWGITITGNRVVYDSPDQPSVTIVVRPRATRAGRIYATRRMTVEIRHGRCNDGMSDRYQADTVLVRFGRSTRSLEGCGGPTLAPASLDDSAWGIVAIDGARIAPAENYQLGFGEGRLTGQAGCNQLSGPYREAGRTLTAGPLISTRMACPEPRMRHERRLSALLGGPLRFSFPDGETLVMTGSGVTIRLRRL